MKVGQTVYLKCIRSVKKYNKEMKESRISKIGKKYFYLEDIEYGRFFIESMKQDNGKYSSKYMAYLSIQEIEDKKEAERLHNKFKELFSGWTTNITLSKLKEIDKIINSN